MTLLQLNYVIKIAEVGSMNKASEILYISQPTLTSAIKELEKEVGFAIFSRTGKGVELTSNGREFIVYARQVCLQYEVLKERFIDESNRKKKVGISSQHYSFATKAFTELLKKYDSSEYEFTFRETTTKNVLNDVRTMKSEVGILFISDFNSKVIEKDIRDYDLEFHPLIDCKACVYLSSKHPLAERGELTFDDLKPYPCISFEQGEADAIYYAEEILSEKNYSRVIKVTDRGSILGTIKELDAYTLCSGIIADEVNGSDYKMIKFKSDSEDAVMHIGYVTKKKFKLSRLGTEYIEIVKDYLKIK